MSVTDRRAPHLFDCDGTQCDSNECGACDCCKYDTGTPDDLVVCHHGPPMSDDTWRLCLLCFSTFASTWNNYAPRDPVGAVRADLSAHMCHLTNVIIAEVKKRG